MDYQKFNDKQIIEDLSRFGDPAKIKVLYVSTYIPNYIRTETILDIFRRNKIKFETIFTKDEKFRYLAAVFKTVSRLREFDVIFLAFRSQEVFPFFRLITRKPIIFDAFVSVYDTMCFDRKTFEPDSLPGKFFKQYDTYLCRQADLVLVDTKTHCQYFKKEFNAENVSYYYLECNNGLFRPIDSKENRDNFVVFWYGKGWPCQGADVILKAAEILKHETGIVFRLVGPIKEKYRNLVSQLDCRNIEFIEYLPYKRLPFEIAEADVCLGGHFSNIFKAKRVIAGKTFQFLACKKKIILGDNSANRELFSETSSINFVKMDSQQELAKKILEIKNKRDVGA